MTTVVCAVRPTTYQPDYSDDVARVQSSPVTFVLPSFTLPTPATASSTVVASAAVLLLPMQGCYSVMAAGFMTQTTSFVHEPALHFKYNITQGLEDNNED